MEQQQSAASQRYLDVLRASLAGLPEPDRDDAVREIESHIALAHADGLPMAAILARLGDPRLLGRAYEANYWLERQPLPGPTTAQRRLSGGKLVRIVGPVLDVQFAPQFVPEIHHALVDLDGGAARWSSRSSNPRQQRRARGGHGPDRRFAARTARPQHRRANHRSGRPGHARSRAGRARPPDRRQRRDRCRSLLSNPSPGARAGRAERRAAHVRDRHQGHRPDCAVRQRRQDRRPGRRRRGQDDHHSGADPQRRGPARWLLGLHRRRRTHP